MAPCCAVNIVTKSGKNAIHGSLFGPAPKRRLQARNYFHPGGSAYARAQGGARIGGPVERYRTLQSLACGRPDRNESQLIAPLADWSPLTWPTGSRQALADVLGVVAPS